MCIRACTFTCLLSAAESKHVKIQARIHTDRIDTDCIHTNRPSCSALGCTDGRLVRLSAGAQEVGVYPSIQKLLEFRPLNFHRRASINFFSAFFGLFIFYWWLSARLRGPCDGICSGQLPNRVRPCGLTRHNGRVL